MPPTVGDLVDPEGLDGAQDPVFEPPAHDPRDRAVDVVPGGVKRPGDLKPRELPRPGREKLHVGHRQMMLAAGPRQEFGHDPAPWTVHAPPGIAEEHRKAPEGDKLKGPLRELVIARPALPAARAIGLGALTGDHLDLDGVRAGLGKAGLAIHEALEMITAIQ